MVTIAPVFSRLDKTSIVVDIDEAFVGVMNHVQVEPMIENVCNQGLVSVVSQFTVPDMYHSSGCVGRASEHLQDIDSVGAIENEEVSLKLIFSCFIPMWLGVELRSWLGGTTLLERWVILVHLHFVGGCIELLESLALSDVPRFVDFITKRQ